MTVAIDVWIGLAGNFLLFVLVFSMSATVDVDHCFKTQVQNFKAITVGAVAQFFVLPILGFITVKILGTSISYPVGLMVLVVTSSPGGSYSNWWCSLFNADLALSVTMTGMSSLISLIMLPLNLYIYTKLTYGADVLANLDWKSLFVALLLVLSAITTGLFCSYVSNSHNFNKIMNRCGNIAGFSLILFSATMANIGGYGTNAIDDVNNNANNEEAGSDVTERIWNHEAAFYIAIATPCILGLFVSILLSSYCNLLKPERVTVAIEACYQNVGIATSIALTMFSDDSAVLSEAIGVPFLYGLLEAFVVGIFCIIAWKCNWTKAPANAPFCHILATSYEVLEAELKDIDGIEVTMSDSSNDNLKNNSNPDKSRRQRQLKLQHQESQEGSIYTTFFDISTISVTKALINPSLYQPPIPARTTIVASDEVEDGKITTL